MAVNCFRQLL